MIIGIKLLPEVSISTKRLPLVLVFQLASTLFTVTVQSVDANWNTNTSGTRLVEIDTGDTSDTEPTSLSLSSGEIAFTLTFKNSRKLDCYS